MQSLLLVKYQPLILLSCHLQLPMGHHLHDSFVSLTPSILYTCLQCFAHWDTVAGNCICMWTRVSMYVCSCLYLRMIVIIHAQTDTPENYYCTCTVAANIKFPYRNHTMCVVYFMASHNVTKFATEVSIITFATTEALRYSRTWPLPTTFLSQAVQ